MLEFTRHGVDCAFRCCLAGPIGSTRPNGATSAGPTAKQSELWEVLTALAAKEEQDGTRVLSCLARKGLASANLLPGGDRGGLRSPFAQPDGVPMGQALKIPGCPPMTFARDFLPKWFAGRRHRLPNQGPFGGHDINRVLVQRLYWDDFLLWQLLLCAIFVVVNAEAWGRTHLCVFIPISERSKKDAALSIAALKTWAKEELQRRAGARVFFVSVGSTRGTPLEAYTVHVPGDLEVGYKRLPVRILKIWHYFSEDRSCDWVMKADSDTYVNLRAVSDRLQCFDSAEEHFFGAVHAIVPPRHLREMWSALYFAHGGSGYMVSRGLLPKIRASAPACLEDMLEMTSGDAMEDVIFALCLQRQLDIQVKSYGFLKPVTHRLWDPAAEPELATQEIVVNFHQARDELLDRRHGPGEPLQRFMHWDAQPPPLHGCIMVAHPVENETDLHEVHSLISRAALAQHHALALLEGDGTRDLEAAEQLREGSRAGHGRCVGDVHVARFLLHDQIINSENRCQYRCFLATVLWCCHCDKVLTLHTPGMATLGYRDSGSVVLSKAEALRQAHEKEGERSRLMTWSKRKSPPRRKKDEREEREKEEAAEFEMKLENIIQKRPDKRLKWLQKGMIMVGRKTIKANAFFDLIMDKVFISDVPAEIGTKMKASVLANLHLFSSKQQKALQSVSRFHRFQRVVLRTAFWEPAISDGNIWQPQQLRM
ncbi:unnamed protein product [Cladocopium goreaui]|uniref:N-acetylgalactosaminide beta-1,3-galactosyltransferase n=1 Tax=Cladocopium goreaui TaxID=2562237 RepID=A0A9P1G6L3_9DINO|nr:unnamed protein product [Cladocopium goreaui]